MRVIQRYNRKICFTEFFDLYRLEIKLCLIIKTLGVTGACPRSAFRQPPPTYRSFSLQPSNHSGICTDARSIAAVCVKIRIVDFDVHDSTTLPISGYDVAMFGNDEVARNGGAGSKEWREVGVVSQSSFRHPRRRRTLFRRAQGTEYRLKCVWGVGSVNLDRQNAERV